MKYIRARVGLLIVSFFGSSLNSRAQANPLHLSFHHVTASVADLEKEASWYERVLGFKRSERLSDGPDFAMYHMTIPSYRIDLVWQQGSSRQHELKGNLEQGWLHIVFQTPDLEAAYRYLKQQGTDVEAKRGLRGKIVHLSLHDPEGNEIGIAVQ